MPTPIGHGLAALAAGWMVERPAAPRRALVVQAVTLVAVGAAPDLDLLIGRHGAEVHSIGAAAIVACAAAWLRWPVARTRWRIGLAVFLAWATHPLLDSMVSDDSAPFGIMALWPFTTAYFHTGWDVFMSVWRHWWEPGWFTHTAAAVVREVVILLPVTALVWWWRRSSK